MTREEIQVTAFTSQSFPLNFASVRKLSCQSGMLRESSMVHLMTCLLEAFQHLLAVVKSSRFSVQNYTELLHCAVEETHHSPPHFCHLYTKGTTGGSSGTLSQRQSLGAQKRRRFGTNVGNALRETNDQMNAIRSDSDKCGEDRGIVTSQIEGASEKSHRKEMHPLLEIGALGISKTPPHKSSPLSTQLPLARTQNGTDFVLSD
ncbi:hypothetical protein STEG23_008081 [Scotinomys teguina]